MKIRFPKIEYSFKIHPKPRGNWRPKVEMSLRVFCPTGGELVWRPWVPNIFFGSPSFVGKWKTSEKDTCFEWSNSDRLRLYDYTSNLNLAPTDIVLPLPDPLYRNPGKDPKNKAQQADYLLVFARGYYTAKEVNSISWVPAEFYLPWRPGRPDYSDFAEAFAKVPQVLYKAFQEGLDSLESKPLSFEFKGTLKARTVKDQTEEVKRNVAEFV